MRSNSYLFQCSVMRKGGKDHPGKPIHATFHILVKMLSKNPSKSIEFFHRQGKILPSHLPLSC